MPLCEPEDRVYTHEHSVGRAVMHDGKQFHRTDPITRGTRGSLIVWARVVGDKCTGCGAGMDASWIFCKSCGLEVPAKV